MAGVWRFQGNGVFQLENPDPRPKVLVYIQTDEVITSYSVLESKLTALGWVRCYDDPNHLQFHKSSAGLHISLPRDFSEFKPMHMFEIVVKTRNVFAVRDV